MQKASNTAAAQQQSKRYVYIVEGLGFGDNEDLWEHCSMHWTRGEADAARERILKESELEATGVRVRVEEVL